MSVSIRAALSLAALAVALSPARQAAAQAGAGSGYARIGLSAPGGGAQSPVATWVAHTNSDNVLRTAVPESGVYESIGALFDIHRERERLESALVGSAEYRDYRGNAGEDDWIASLGALASVLVVPERFTWSFQENIGQGRGDPFAPDTPQNRESIGVFSTRPELNLPLGGRTSLILASTYSNRKYEESTFLDGDSVTQELGVQRLIAPETTIGLFASRDEVDYDETPTQQYEIEEAVGRYDRTLAHGAAHIEVGRNRLMFNNSTVVGPVVDLNWERSAGTRSIVTVGAHRGYSDTGELYQGDPDQIGGAPPDALLSSDATDHRQADITYELTLTKTDVALWVTAISDDFVQQTALNSEARLIGVDILRRMTPRMSFSVSVHQERREFDSSGDASNDDTFLGVSLTRRLTNQLALEARVQRSERQGDGAYDEQAYQLSLIYTPRPTGTDRDAADAS